MVQGQPNYGQPHPNHQMFQQNSQPPLPPPQMSQTMSGLPRRERSISNESRKREKSVERTHNMMKREANNSRTNLEVNNSSIISAKSKTNASTVMQNIYQKQPVQNQISVQSQFVSQSQTSFVQPSQQSYVQQPTQGYAQQQNQQYVQQQVNVSNGINFFSQTNTNTTSVVSSRTNQPSDPFSSFQQSSVLNGKGFIDQERGSMFISSQDIDLSIYPGPHPISPMGKYLGKLLPPN